MKNITQLLLVFLGFSLVLSSLFLLPKSAHAVSANFGVAGFVSSLPSSSNKATVVSEAKNAGFGWVREEYTYSDSIDFAPYDAAYSKIHGSGLKILGLLTYPGDGVSHEDWKNYVKNVVGHFPGVSAWEIMNEVDNNLSPADYTVYLKEASAIIRSKGGATIVLSGVTARKEVYPFWDGVKASGGWDAFDVVGLHMFHDGVPTEDSYNNGTLSQEVQKVVNSINKNGGGKKIWVTEIGYDSDNYGLSNEANWLVQSLGIIHGFSEVDKIFVFRLYDHGNGLGLLTSNFKEKEAYGAVKTYLTGGVSSPVSPPVAKASPTPAPAPSQSVDSDQSAAPAPIIADVPVVAIDKTKSFIRLDGKNIAADGQAQYRIVVGLEDANGQALIDRKPGIILAGGQTNLTDFVLVGNEWFAYVSSTDAGDRTAQISADGQDLGTLKMTYVAAKVPVTTEVSQPVNVPPIATAQNKLSNKISKIYIIVISCAAAGVLILAGVYVFWRKKFRK
jgi:hypothetical protein